MTSKAGGLYGGIQFAGKPALAPSSSEPPPPPKPVQPDAPPRTQSQAPAAPTGPTAPAAKPSAGISSSVYHNSREPVNRNISLVLSVPLYAPWNLE